VKGKNDANRVLNYACGRRAVNQKTVPVAFFYQRNYHWLYKPLNSSRLFKAGWQTSPCRLLLLTLDREVGTDYEGVQPGINRESFPH